MDGFQFTIGDVVLAEWTDKLFYAKILHINRSRLTCTLLFDDDSVDDCPISKIHSVTETTADIVCIICKDGSSTKPNEIVLCDKCGIGNVRRHVKHGQGDGLDLDLTSLFKEFEISDHSLSSFKTKPPTCLSTCTHDVQCVFRTPSQGTFLLETKPYTNGNYNRKGQS